MHIAEDLYLYMPRTLGIFFDQYGIVTKTVDGFAFARLQCCIEVFCLFDGAHALAAASCAGLDQHRIANAVRFAFEQRRRLVAAVVARDQRHAGFFHKPFGLGFEAHCLDG